MIRQRIFKAINFQVLIFLIFLYYWVDGQQLNIKLSNGKKFSLLYNSSSATECDSIKSSKIDNNVKCLILCQMTECKSIGYDARTNKCTIHGSRPELIRYDKLDNISLVYVLGISKITFKLNYFSTLICNRSLKNGKAKHLRVGDPCKFDFTCGADGYIPRCSNGYCNCIRDRKK